MAYVLSLAFANRVVQCAQTFGYAFPDDASRLKQVATGIQLPEVLCLYIEALGRYRLASGIYVAPYVQDYRQWFTSPLMLDPKELLIEAGRAPGRGNWSIDKDWILHWNDSTTRASRSGMNFRTVNNLAFEGKPEMTVSCIQVGDETIAVAPQVITSAEAQKGACYQFRHYGDRADWVGTNKDLLFDACQSTPFDIEVVYNDCCVASFRGQPMN